MQLSAKQQIEQACFNQIVHQKWDGKSLWVDKDSPPFATYNGDLWDGARQFLGDVTGKKILEIGCGNGELTVWLAKNGAAAYGLDISDESIKVAEQRTLENHTVNQAKFFIGPAEQLPFENNCFDVVFVNVSLHHLEVETALQEFKRVLKATGKLVAVEPLIFSKTIQNFRTSRLVTRLYPIRQETPTERILTRADLKLVGQYFYDLDFIPFRVFSPFIFKIQSLFLFLAQCLFRSETELEIKKQKMIRKLQHWDELLLKIFPFLRFLSRYVVIAANKQTEDLHDPGPHIQHRPLGLVVVVLYKGLWGALEFLIGLGLIFSSRLIAAELFEDPQDIALRWLINNFHPNFKLALGLGAIVSLFGLFKIVVAVGIWYRSYTIRNIALIFMSIFAIFATYELLIKFSGFKLMALAIDLVIIFYFWKILPKHFRHGQVE